MTQKAVERPLVQNFAQNKQIVARRGSSQRRRDKRIFSIELNASSCCLSVRNKVVKREASPGDIVIVAGKVVENTVVAEAADSGDCHWIPETSTKLDKAKHVRCKKQIRDFH